MKKTYDAFHLKLIAIIAMFINHLGHTFEKEFNPPLWEFIYLAIGYLTFPIMVYLLVEGFFYTRSRLRYAGRLFVFACLSVLPFHFLFDTGLPFIYPLNNILFTLLFGIIMMSLCEKVTSKWGQALILILFMFLALLSDWSFLGIIIMFIFYKAHKRQAPIRPRLLWIFVIILLSWFPDSLEMSQLVKFVSSLGVLLIIPLLTRYDGSRGYSPKWVKWGFYAFYPLHLSVLWLIRYLLFGY